jgi:hypothetical protein
MVQSNIYFERKEQGCSLKLHGLNVKRKNVEKGGAKERRNRGEEQAERDRDREN